MHCVSEYPANIEKINLNTINFLKKLPLVKLVFLTILLFSTNLCTLWWCRNNRKHFTLNNTLSKFRDHSLSLNPKDFKDEKNKRRENFEYKKINLSI